MYPMGGGLSSNHHGQMIDNYKSRAHVDVLPETGESHLIIGTDVVGDLEMSVGDEIRAYANNKLVALSKSRIAQLMQLKEEAIAKGDNDKVKDIESELFLMKD